MNIIFSRIAWHPKYNGKYPLPYTGANWQEKEDNEYGEWLNFKNFEGHYYGYATANKWKIDLTNFGSKEKNGFIHNVTIVWIAPDPNGGSKIVGWYKNATVYSEPQTRPAPLTYSYFFKAKTKDCVLLPEERRIFNFNKKFRYLWYKDIDPKIREDVIGYIDSSDNYADFDDPVEVDFKDSEGKKILKTHIKTERSIRLIKEFKKSLVSFKCSVCGFDFEKTYGTIGKDFIEAHHKKPVSSLKLSQEVSIKDLVAVCSNCHRMLHRKTPPFTVRELKSKIK